MYVKDMFKKGFLLIFTIFEYSQGNRYKHSSLHGVCHHSTRTIEYVSSCPTTEDAWKERENQKRCWEVKQDCVPTENFVYHCAVNEWRNATLEVCAPLRIIFGHYCMEYNVPAERIQFNREGCATLSKPCPIYYQSTDVYLYPECFKTISIYTVDMQKRIPGQELNVMGMHVDGRDTGMNEDISSTNYAEREFPVLFLLLLISITTLAFAFYFVNLNAGLLSWKRCVNFC